jgi:hypothetical protein
MPLILPIFRRLDHFKVSFLEKGELVVIYDDKFIVFVASSHPPPQIFQGVHVK